MPFIAALVAVAIVFYFVLRASRVSPGSPRVARNTGGGPCRWKLDKSRRFSGQHRFVCGACGQEAFTEDGARPRVCVVGLRAQGR